MWNTIPDTYGDRVLPPVQASLWDAVPAPHIPGVETPGYSQLSLRDLLCVGLRSNSNVRRRRPLCNQLSGLRGLLSGTRRPLSRRDN
jgi:hypothetical protein